MCDTFCVRRPGGGALFAKNSDRPPGEVQLVEFHARRSGETGSRAMQYVAVEDAAAHAVVLSRPAWLVGAEHGVNEHGLAVGNERVYADRDLRAEIGLTGMDLVRLVLERAATADEALAVLTTLLRDHGQGGSGIEERDDPYDSSFLLTDPTGGWIVETCGRDWAARRTGDSAAISNRYVIGTAADEWSGGGRAPDTGGWHDPRVDTRIADHRLAVTRRTAAGSPDIAAAVGTLRDHGDWSGPPPAVGDDLTGVTVCMHVPGLLATTASMVAELDRVDLPRLWVCVGSPCVGVYLPCRFDAVPDGLADPERWQLTRRLRDHVEARPERLCDVRAVLDPLEAELWEGAAGLDRLDVEQARARGEADLGRIDAAVVTLLAKT